MKKVKVAVIGTGASGLFFLYALAKLLAKLGERAKGVEVVVFDVGPDFGDRHQCPLTLKKTKMIVCPEDACSYCPPGQSGGNATDFKVIVEPSEYIGGRLFRLIGEGELRRHLAYVHRTIVEHAPCELPIARPDPATLAWINRLATEAGMKYYPQVLLHAGTDNASAINLNILETIRETVRRSGLNIVFNFNRQVRSLSRRGQQFVVRYDKFRKGFLDPYPEKEEVFDAAIVSVGRSGVKWLAEQPIYGDLDVSPGQVDVGIRVETLASVMAELDEKVYEPKLYFTTLLGLIARHFCSNRKGKVVVENHDRGGYVLVNGAAALNEETLNSNFAVLVGQMLMSPHAYAREVAQRVNAQARGGTLVQTLGDLMAGRATSSLDGNEVQSTHLGAVPGDLRLCFPNDVLDGIVEYLGALNHFCPGIFHKRTLLHAPEVKTYSDLIAVTQGMETTTIPWLWIIGDAAVSRGLGQAMASGSVAAEELVRKLAA